MYRTPPKGESKSNDHEIIEYPTGRLAAVTRKKHEIENYMRSPTPNSDKFTILFTQFNEKVFNFQEAGKLTLYDKELAAQLPEYFAEFKEWYQQHNNDMQYFIEQMSSFRENIPQTEGDLNAEDSVSNIASYASKKTTTSRISHNSQVSTLRLKMIEEKAADQAKVLSLDKRNKLDEAHQELRRKAQRAQDEAQRSQEEARYAEEDQRRKYELAQEQLRLDEKAIYREILEKSLDEYEENRSSCADRRSKASRSKVSFIQQSELEQKINTEPIHRNPYFNVPTVNTIETGLNIAHKLQSEQPIMNTLQDQITKTMMMVAKNQVKFSLPKYEPTNFDGKDPTLYHIFIHDFNSMIADHCESNSDKLHYLQKYTSGLPLELVKSCRGKDPTTGFDKAIKLLDKEFGNEINIAEAYIKKLNNWKVIKNEDGQALREYAIFLMGCSNLIEDFSSLSQLNSPAEIYKCAMKLPYKLRERWRQRVQKIQSNKNRESFQNLTDFVHDQSILLNLPLYSTINDPKPEKVTSKNLPSDNKKKVFSTSIEETKNSKKPCLVCKKNNHDIYRCFFFKQKSHEEKSKFVFKNQLCFSCLKDSHQSRECPKRLKCQICEKLHPTVMHKYKDEKSKPQSDNKDKTPEDYVQEESIKPTYPDTEDVVARVMSTTHTENASRTIHPVIPVKVKLQGSDKTVMTYMGIDPFCSEVFMDQELSKKLGLKGIETSVTMTTMHRKHLATKTRVVNNLEILDLEENENTIIPVVYTRTPWPFEKEDSPLPSDIEKCPYLQNVPFQFIDEKIGLLVGINQPNLTKPIDIVTGPNEDSPYATQHKFGWAFNGVVDTSGARNAKCFRIKVSSHQPDIETVFKQYCNRDFVDESPGMLCPSTEDLLWENKIKNSYIKRPDGKYEVGLPFKRENPDFPNNREQVFRRLMSSKRRLKTDKAYFDKYVDFMDLMLKNEFAERVESFNLKVDQGNVWYLVHFGVIHKRSKKLRIVFDASLKYRGVSLNSSLLQGPDLTNNLLGVLLRFRENKVAVSADIQKMFYAVKVKERHQDYLRFFWFPNNNLDENPIEYRVTVHIFGAVSSPSIANYVLRQSAQTKAATKYTEETRQSVEKEFYVDDWMKSTETVERASLLISEVTAMLAHSGFKLTSFISNNRYVLSKVDQAELRRGIKELDLAFDDLPYERALGVYWNIEKDTFGHHLNLIERDCSKRGVLSTIFSVYDPLGFVCPAILPAKKIFQVCCHNKLDWDDQLSPDEDGAWSNWKRTIGELSNFEIPRCLKQCFDLETTQLHLFCDGSEKAYATVAYLRFKYTNLTVHCSFTMAKSRIVPLKGTAVATIPRIELNGAKLAVNLSQILLRELTFKIEDTYFWTDSTTVLKYLQSKTRRFQRFVSNRVSFINQHSRILNWRHVPTEINPADIASRGTSPSVLIASKLWRFGPEFLWKAETEWPVMQHIPPLLDDDPEIVKLKGVFAVKMENKSPTDCLLESSSSWYKTRLRVAWFLRFKKGLMAHSWNTSRMTVQELMEAELSIWRYIQKLNFPLTIERLSKNEFLSRKDCLSKLNPFLSSDRLLRVGGRICNADVPYNAKHQIILPKQNHLVKTLVRHVHEIVGHLGRESMLSHLRQQYWIVGANSLARDIIHHCISCRKRQGRPNTQIMGDLPEDRVSANEPVFSQIGIDVFGPFSVVRGRKPIKRYGLIFTCLTSRAVHLEMLSTLETDSFIQALRRFAARRGYPSLIRSDNGTNFVGAEKVLREEICRWNSKTTLNWMLQKNIQWKFQPPVASHFGGCWERQIRTIRKVLSSLTNHQPLNDENLYTLFCEVESILNSIPLTSVSDDISDLEPLTPNHLLLARSGPTFPPGLFDKHDMYAKRKWKQIQYLSDNFWSRWKREYLSLLQERNKWKFPQRSLQVGDLVLLMDQLLPRNQWSLGRIIHVYLDRHERVRVVDVRVNKVKGEPRPLVLKRPIHKLILLCPAVTSE